MGDFRDSGSGHRRPRRRGHHPGHQQSAARHQMKPAATPPPRRGPARRGRPGRDQGSASIEFAITAVAVLAVIFAVIQASTYFWARSIAAAAAQEGADTQRAYNAAPGAGQARANTFITSTGDGLSGTTVTVTTDGQQ